MNEEANLDKVLELSIRHWIQTFGGISASELCGKISMSNEDVMVAMERLCNQGKGVINAHVKLYRLKINLENLSRTSHVEPIVTHVFFPSEEVLTEYYYSSSLVRENYAEFKKRLCCGAQQLEMAVFSDEVLTRYFNHPELYDVDDSLSGGHILAKSEAPDSRYLYVRHGKRNLENGRTAVTAIYKDLSMMSAEEQRHWHSYEISESEFEQHDPNFMRFMARTYEGAWVDFPNPIMDVIDTLMDINTASDKGGLFKRTNNDHFRPPVENTEKAYYDCCSEFYKLIGPDSLNQQTIKSILIGVFSVNNSELFHNKSERPLSSLQLLSMLEEKMEVAGLLTKVIRKVGEYRIEADHKVTEPLLVDCNFVEKFTAQCEDFVKAGKLFAGVLVAFSA